MSRLDRYGDYRNYLTWTVAETIKNNRKLLNEWLDYADNLLADYSEKKALRILAKELESEICESISTDGKLAAELVKSAITDVDFEEIADMLLSYK